MSGYDEIYRDGGCCIVAEDGFLRVYEAAPELGPNTLRLKLSVSLQAVKPVADYLARHLAVEDVHSS